MLFSPQLIIPPPKKVLASGVWTTVFTWSTAALADDTGWGTGFTFVARVPLASFSVPGGTRIRLTFDGPGATVGLNASDVFIGEGGGTDPYDFSTTPVRMTTAGSNALTLAIGSTDTVTDDVAFTKDAVNPFLIAFNFASSSRIRRSGYSSTTFFSWYKTTGGQAGTQDKTAYSNNLESAYIKKIELLI